MKYKGWIPVVSGFLSFSNIRGQIIPGRCHEPPEVIGCADDPEFKVRSTRTLDDRPFASYRTRPGSSPDAYDFECRAKKVTKSDGQEFLSGIVIAHPRIESSRAAQLKELPTICPGIYPDSLCWVIHFELARDGCIILDWGDLAPDQIGLIVDLTDADVGLFEKLLTFETFSFLKDLIHNHKFHGTSDDSIVVPVKVTDDSDERWRDETARNIHRAIISSVRNLPAQLELTNALGKICYLRTFLSISKTRYCDQLSASLENLERSVETRLTRESFVSNAFEVVKNLWMSISLACVATGITLLQLLQVPCITGLSYEKERCAVAYDIPQSALDALALLLSNWSSVSVVLIGLFLLMGYLATRRSILELYSQRTGSEGWTWHLIRFFYGLSLTSGRYIALTWLTSLVITLLILLGTAISALVK